MHDEFNLVSCSEDSSQTSWKFSIPSSRRFLSVVTAASSLRSSRLTGSGHDFQPSGSLNGSSATITPLHRVTLLGLHGYPCHPGPGQPRTASPPASSPAL